MDGRLKHPFTCIVAGLTMSGETEWTKTLVRGRHAFVDTPIDDVIWCYGQWQNGYKEPKPHLRFVEGLVDAEDLDTSHPHLVVICDFIDFGDKRIQNFFTKVCHHLNTSCLYLMKNFYNQGKGHRT